MGQFADLKEAFRARRNSKNPLVRLLVSLSTIGYQRVRALMSAEHRSVLLLKLFRARSVHQTTPQTAMDRYPDIFAACRDYFGGRADLKILSFGCSTGEEVVTLRTYFPSATIVGAEINRRSLAICKKRALDERCSFLYSDPALLAKAGPFDAIFCMAVLQRTPRAILEGGITDLSRTYPFEKFDRQVSALDALLVKDGLLVIHHTQYFFRDAAAASNYVPLRVGRSDANPYPRFGRDSRRVSPDGDAADGSIFKKVGVSPLSRAEVGRRLS